ncbi:hypothetical protein MUO65_00085 [bacterium]|nr:hypothetical protein [bacterium]
MVKSAKGSERLYQCLVNVESVNRIFEIAREHYSKSKSANSKIDLRKLFNLPKPWYIVLTEDNLLELSFPLYFVESLIEKFLGSESLKKFRKRCQEGLFLLHEKDGKTYISVYNFLRSSLIDNCESMGYSESRIKQITKFDDFLAKLFIEETEPNLNGSPLVLLTKYVRWMDAEDKEIQREKNFSHEEIKRRRLEVLEQIPEGKIDLCDFVDRLNSEGVSPKEEIFVNRLATLIRIRNDGAILGLMSLLH